MGCHTPVAPSGRVWAEGHFPLLRTFQKISIPPNQFSYSRSMAFLNLLLLLLIFLIFGSIQCPTTYEDQCPILEWAMEEELPELEFSLDWSVLGPFQIGTRGTFEPFIIRKVYNLLMPHSRSSVGRRSFGVSRRVCLPQLRSECNFQKFTCCWCNSTLDQNTSGQARKLRA
jgi:hypothetical protein